LRRAPVEDSLAHGGEIDGVFGRVEAGRWKSLRGAERPELHERVLRALKVKQAMEIDGG